jgi:inositol oxygenase
MLITSYAFSTEENRDHASFRNYETNVPEHVKELYLLNHQNQTLQFVLEKKDQYLSLQQCQRNIWDVIAELDTFIDKSDPDLDLPQSYHFFQTAEALRKDGQPRWLILTGFIHDVGKILSSYGEEQWAVVGDTFPVGCRFSEKIVFSEYFADNPDLMNSQLQTDSGIYFKGIGLDQVHMSWGHDEYLYQVVKNYLPEEALFIIRFHSFYPLHRDGEYSFLLNDSDREKLPWLKLFCQYDLYSKSSEMLDLESLRPYYEELVSEFLPDQLNW